MLHSKYQPPLLVPRMVFSKWWESQHLFQNWELQNNPENEFVNLYQDVIKYQHILLNWSVSHQDSHCCVFRLSQPEFSCRSHMSLRGCFLLNSIWAFANCSMPIVQEMVNSLVSSLFFITSLVVIAPQLWETLIVSK